VVGQVACLLKCDCSALQCVVVLYSAWKCVAGVAVRCKGLQCIAVRCSALKCAEVGCVLQCIPMSCSDQSDSVFQCLAVIKVTCVYEGTSRITPSQVRRYFVRFAIVMTFK